MENKNKRWKKSGWKEEWRDDKKEKIISLVDIRIKKEKNRENGGRVRRMKKKSGATKKEVFKKKGEGRVGQGRRGCRIVCKSLIDW